MELAQNFGWQDIVIESDCATVVNTHVACLSPGGHIVEAIKFHFSSFHYVSDFLLSTFFVWQTL